MIKYYSTFKGLACNCDCELALYAEDKESYYFTIKAKEK